MQGLLALSIGKTACGRFSDIDFLAGRTKSSGTILDGASRPEAY
jgi:hypothetical protein